MSKLMMESPYLCEGKKALALCEFAQISFLVAGDPARRALWYPTQTKTGLEWGTQPSFEIEGGVCETGGSFHPHRTPYRKETTLNFVIPSVSRGTCSSLNPQRKLGAPFKPAFGFGLSGIPQRSTRGITGNQKANLDNCG
jgi:hypothetical protein